MSRTLTKSLTLDIPARDAERLEAVLDEALIALRRLDKKSVKRDAEVTQLKTETRLLMRAIRERLNVAEAL